MIQLITLIMFTSMVIIMIILDRHLTKKDKERDLKISKIVIADIKNLMTSNSHLISRLQRENFNIEDETIKELILKSDESLRCLQKYNINDCLDKHNMSR